MTKPKKSKALTPLKDAMQQSGFSASAAQAQSDFWASMGITGVRIGSTVLTVPPVPTKKKD
jgi:hypothetical protein